MLLRFISDYYKSGHIISDEPNQLHKHDMHVKFTAIFQKRIRTATTSTSK